MCVAMTCVQMSLPFHRAPHTSLIVDGGADVQQTLMVNTHEVLRIIASPRGGRARKVAITSVRSDDARLCASAASAHAPEVYV
jgi:hypothetical protein